MSSFFNRRLRHLIQVHNFQSAASGSVLAGHSPILKSQPKKPHFTSFRSVVLGAVLCLGQFSLPAHAQVGATEDGEAIVANQAQNYNPMASGSYPAVAGTYPTPQPTPQQTERQNRMQETNIRNLIRSLGVNVREMQDMVISHIANETQAREPMRAASGRLLQAMRTPGVTEAQLSVLLNDCRVSFDTDKVRRAEALDALKTKIGPNLTPRIESMMLLLGLEGDVIITLPSPTMLSQMQRERQQLLKMVEGLKIEADSLRRERDDIKTEYSTYQKSNAPYQGVKQTANAQINPNGLYNLPAVSGASGATVTPLTEEQKELALLRDEIAALKKENKSLQKENTNLRRAEKDERGEGNKDRKSENKVDKR